MYLYTFLKWNKYVNGTCTCVNVSLDVYKTAKSSEKKISKTQILNKTFFFGFFFTIRLQQINITIYHLSGDPWKNNMMTTGNLS